MTGDGRSAGSCGGSVGVGEGAGGVHRRTLADAMGVSWALRQNAHDSVAFFTRTCRMTTAKCGIVLPRMFAVLLNAGKSS